MSSPPACPAWCDASSSTPPVSSSTPAANAGCSPALPENSHCCSGSAAATSAATCPATSARSTTSPNGTPTTVPPTSRTPTRGATPTTRSSPNTASDRCETPMATSSTTALTAPRCCLWVDVRPTSNPPSMPNSTACGSAWSPTGQRHEVGTAAFHRTTAARLETAEGLAAAVKAITRRLDD